MTELDHLNVDLSGTNLIEASAGTGKTYAIACLYLRLLVERGLTPEQILVVTYTEAATKELRSRIRQRVREAIGVIDGNETDDPFLLGLVANSNGKGPDRDGLRAELDRALNAFDTASIFTIHGFSLRALQENAFESGSLYDTELITDQDGLLREIVDDFWRARFFAEQSPLLACALRNRLSPDYFSGFLKGMLGNAKLEIAPQFTMDEIAAIEAACRESHEKVCAVWRENRREIEEIFLHDKGLGRAADTYRHDLIPALFAGMDGFASGINPYDLFPGFDKFTTSGIAAGKKPKGVAPFHPFFERCEELGNQVGQRLLALRWELLSFARERLPGRKREMNIRYFDDLLADLYAALCSEGSDQFAVKLRGKYRAALIDEFQDTDPVQYEIFRKICMDADFPLFLIGDPKQAIYSFRGADIFAYMEAAGDVGEGKRFTLTGNWRSTPRLLHAFNTIFSNDKKPFLYDEISYHPVKPGKGEAGSGQGFALDDDSPLQVWYMPPDEDGKAISVGKANTLVPLAVASEIVRLLKGGAGAKPLIDGKPVVPGDIAVVVRSHLQAGYVQEALKDLGIPSVMQSNLSIFATAEAREVCILLSALADPGSESKVRAALVTDILGRSGDDIARLLEDEHDWEECLQKFRTYHHVWLNRGFMVMAQSLLTGEGVRGRLLRRSDGERRLTNILHCFEVIHNKEHERGAGIEGMVTWFGEKTTSGDMAEEYQIRLETDEKAVKIVTIHVSKGLEYPIVFCPFMWGGTKEGSEVVACHEGFTMVKDYGSPEYARRRAAARKEALAENLRLLYVAVTRAKHRCYLFAGKISDRNRKNRPETSPLAYLFHADAETRVSDDPVNTLETRISALTAEQMIAQLQTLAEKGQGAIAALQAPEAAAVLGAPFRDEEKRLSCRRFSGVVSSDWRVASFTSFAAHEATAVELPDRDEALAGAATFRTALEEPPEGKSIFTFPRGARAGIFLHEIFELLDFSGSSPEVIVSLVEKGLQKHGYDRDWQPHISAMVNNVVTAPLSSPDGTFTLSGLNPGSWIPELEFFFPLRFVTSELLGGCLRKWGAIHDTVDFARLPASLSFKPVRGMVRGFMDMVFEQGGRYYLVDWKSNHLGYRVEDYGREALQGAMESNLYPLQYLLYTVALNRHLSIRVKGYDYDRHFGGVIYLFLRGVSPGHGEEFGVFRDLPPAGMIAELTHCLIQAGG